MIPLFRNEGIPCTTFDTNPVEKVSATDTIEKIPEFQYSMINKYTLRGKGNTYASFKKKSDKRDAMMKMVRRKLNFWRVSLVKIIRRGVF